MAFEWLIQSPRQSFRPLSSATESPLNRLQGLTTEGYLFGLEHTFTQESLEAYFRATRPFSPKNHAAYYLTLISSGHIKTNGRIPHKDETRAGLSQGFREIFGDPLPKAAKSLIMGVSRCIDFHLGDVSSGDDVFSLGLELANLLKERIRLGEIAGVSPSILRERAHLRDMEKYVFMMGWYDAQAALAPPSIRTLLNNNRASVLSRALNNGDILYPSKVVFRLPEIVTEIETFIKTSLPEVGTRTRNNFPSIIHKVLTSGDLTSESFKSFT